MEIKPIEKTLSGEKIVFRNPKSGEGFHLLNFFQPLFHESSELLNYPSHHYDDRKPEEQEHFIKIFNQDPLSFTIFAYSNEDIVGNIVVKNLGYERAAHRAVLTMGVLNRWQCKGIGNFLMNLAIETATTFGILSLELRVRTSNSSAIKLYEKYGFNCVGTILGAAKLSNTFVNEQLYIRNDTLLLELLAAPNIASDK